MRPEVSDIVKTGKRTIETGENYNRFFGTAKGENIRVKKEATLADTIKWIRLVIAKTLDQTKELANYLQGERVTTTCKRIWSFCFNHCQYARDEERKEQIRTPNRAWMDRHDHIGIDCDCFTVTICSILQNLKIPYVMRITKYEADEFEHIYPVAFTPEGEEIIIDCVVHQFNYEVPYTAKKDIPMDLEILNGAPAPFANDLTQDDEIRVGQQRFNEFGDKVSFEHDLPIDAADLFLDNEMELEGLEGRAERQAKRDARKAKRNRPKEVKKAERKEKRQAVVSKIKQGIHSVNKVNPAALLLRAGILASMKLNLFKVASHLRFAYWSTDQARANEMDLGKFNELKRIREKLEQIYFRAGGKPGKLKEAILTGKGNRNKMVSLNGLGSLVQMPSDEDDLKMILGDDIFYSELNGIESINGLGSLGAVATGAAITAASGAMGVIAGLIKKLGGLFKKGSKSAQKFEIQNNTDNEEEKTRRFSVKNIVNKIRTKVQERRARKAGESAGTDLTTTGGEVIPEDEFIMEDPFVDSMSRSQDIDADFDETATAKRTFGEWLSDNKVAVGIGTGVLVGGTILTVYLIKKNKKAKALNGAPKAKTKKKKSIKTKSSKTFVPRSRGRRQGAIKIQPIL
ncbi:MAG: hypothetical protein MK086_14220 [Flavobacteriales bacterium]|nr:hypothetical protein [Flavobacteriales bacterium]